jgi:hypothetical protein
MNGTAHVGERFVALAGFGVLCLELAIVDV